MPSPTISGLLLSSTNPERLRDWYVKALQPDVNEDQDQYKILGFGGFYLLIDSRDDVGEKNSEPGRHIVNFEVDDAKAAVDRLNEAGATWLAKLEDRDGSYFATAIDPDGNYAQVIQLSEEAKAAMSSDATT